jgi:small subunit ribosomal protein S1
MSESEQLEPGAESAPEEQPENQHQTESAAESAAVQADQPKIPPQTESTAEHAETPEEHADDADSDLNLFEKYLEEDIQFEPSRGDLCKGVIVEIRPNEVLVNVGSKRDGVVPQSDLSRLDPDFVANLHEGQTVDVVVSKQTDDENVFLLSMSDALQQKDWILAQELLESGETTMHTVVGFNKGGLTVEFNHLRGFVPASHIVDMPRNLSEDARRQELERHIGQELRLKVIEVERRRRRLVMSQMLAEREYRARRKKELFQELKVGDELEGIVRSIRPFGAFVDIGGADGLLHVSEIDWAPVKHPRDVLKVGDKVKVKVIRLDPDRHRIALSRKRVLPNPWDTIDKRYHQGDFIPVIITRVVDFGAFAQIEPGVEGLIHISELADITVAEPLKTVRPGDKVPAKILRIDSRRQRVGLSVRQAQDAGVTIESLTETPEEPEPADEKDAAEDVVEKAGAEASASDASEKNGDGSASSD